MQNKFIEKLTQAREILPLKVLMKQRGRGPSNDKGKSFPCPYCEGKRTAGVFSGSHGDQFKCHNPSCRSSTAGDGQAWDEIGFLAFELGCDRRAATRAWLEEAGLWDDHFKSALESKSVSHICPRENAETNAVDSESGDEKAKKLPLVVFYEVLSLSEADHKELETKRGLSVEAIDASGLRTNCHANLELLLSLAENFEEWELVKSGLWTRKEKHSKPNAQYYGLGVLGKKKKLSPELLDSGDYSEYDDDDFVWEWKESGKCNPYLIPYFDWDSNLIGLRPHKGFPRGQTPRLYLAGGRGAIKQCKRIVITEGELKAIALHSILGSTWAVAAIPGITMIKNFDVWSDILIWLQKLGAAEIVFAFDNEEQSNPALPHYKPQLEDRFEAEVWARVGAMRLKGEGYRARVAHLPDEWRNEQGKADWDSALAALLKGGKSHDEIAALFEGVLQNAQTPAELAYAKFFGEEAERSIKRRVDVRAYEPVLPWGGPAEQKIADNLKRLAEKILPEWKARILSLADAYRKTKGHYYEFKISEQRCEKLKAELATAEHYEQIKYLKLALKGTPGLVAPFRLIPCFVLVRPDGTRVRMVKLRNIRGECTGLIALDSDSLTAPRDFRRCLAQNGNFTWRAGERQLQALQQDIDFYLGFCEVRQLVCYGCERPGDPWVFDDCAFDCEGKQVLPNHGGIFHHQGVGYALQRNLDGVPIGEEDQAFRFKSRPRMHPGQGLSYDSQGKITLKPGCPDDPSALQDLLGNFVLNLHESYSKQDGEMLVGAAVGFFAAPELYAERNQFPGIWIHGEKGGGKTATAQWLLALFGFKHIESGLSFKTSTAVGMQIALGQYANIPVWGDEYKEGELYHPNVVGVVHGGFNREIASKWSADGRTRSIRTSLLVTGESTSSNTATMSRYVTVVAAREKRVGTEEEQLQRLKWLQSHRQYFFAVGRVILCHRAGFVERFKTYLEEWEHASELASVEPRARFTYGVSYAGFMALNELVPIYDSKQSQAFRQRLVNRTIEAHAELAARVDVITFLRILLSAYHAGVFGRSASERRRFFKFMANQDVIRLLTKGQLKDAADHPRLMLVSGILYFAPGPVIDAVRQYLYSQGQKLALDQFELHAQLKPREFFVTPRNRQGHQQKFGKDKTNTYCWAFDLNKLPELGVIPVSDEVWEVSFYPEGDKTRDRLPLDEWVDPRKGEMFSIVDGLQEKES